MSVTTAVASPVATSVPSAMAASVEATTTVEAAAAMTAMSAATEIQAEARPVAITIARSIVRVVTVIPSGPTAVANAVAPDAPPTIADFIHHGMTSGSIAK